MVSTVSQADGDFLAAASNWDVEKLYVDLATAKGKGLTPLEKKLLRGLLCGYSPAEIAEKIYKSRSSSAVRVYLSNGVYKYIQELLQQQQGKDVSVKSWSRVTNLLEQAGYKIQLKNQSQAIAEFPTPEAESHPFDLLVNKYQAWQEAIDLDIFYGRHDELAQLQQWIVEDNCRLVAILGMGGVGKTSLAIKLAELIQDEFEYLIWRSLEPAPSIESLLTDLLLVFSPEPDTTLPTTTEGQISRLIGYLRSHRCLLVFDRAEAVLRSNDYTGAYREGYEDYGQLFRRLGEEYHCSCSILTSRENPKEIALNAGEELLVHTYYLSGLQSGEAIELLILKGLLGSDNERRLLVKCYANNPLALKIVATTIQNLFDGSITDFMAEATILFGDIYALFEEQFNRLSDLEKQLLYALLVHHKLISFCGWQQDGVFSISKREQLEALESLQRRSLLQKKSTTLPQYPLLKVYIAEKLAEQVSQEMSNKAVAQLVSHTILSTLLKDEPTSFTSPTTEQRRLY
jgi:hypothetical protein